MLSVCNMFVWLLQAYSTYKQKCKCTENWEKTYQKVSNMLKGLIFFFLANATQKAVN